MSWLLGELGIDQRERDAVERQIPRRVPRVFPLVGHRDDVGVVQLHPVVSFVPLPLARRRRAGGVAVEPVADDVVVELLRPEQARKRLAHHALAFDRQVIRDDVA